MDKQKEDKEEENDFEDFDKWNDDKREVDETRQKEIRRRMNTHRMTELRMRRDAGKEEEKKTRTDIYLYNNQQLLSSEIAAAWCVQRITITGSII